MSIAGQLALPAPKAAHLHLTCTLTDYGDEQAINPRKDIPFAIMLSMGVVTTLYILMCMAITLAVPYYNIDRKAPFSVLFKSIDGWHWASYLVSIGAVLGVGTVLLVRLSLHDHGACHAVLLDLHCGTAACVACAIAACSIACQEMGMPP